MRRFLSLFLAFALLLTGAALAKAPVFTHNFGDFTLVLPEDITGSIAEEKVANEVFFTLYQDYSENNMFNKSLDCVWTEEIVDYTAIDAAEYTQVVLDSTVAQLSAMGIGISDAAVIEPALEEHDGYSMLTYALFMNVDYTALGIDLKLPLYTLFAQMSDEAVGGSYSFTITTDDPENTQALMDIMDSLDWTI